jgi:uncharacterized damage-inducible protein DinB
MIDQEYVLQMSRYNAWQNSQLSGVVQLMDEADLAADRGAFFGSIFATLNHLLWGDTLWMNRWCSDVQAPKGGNAVHKTFTPNIAAWGAARSDLDGHIRNWAQTLSNEDLRGDLEWTSESLGKTITQPLGLCVLHMFNHQIHHRGQISQMLSAAGLATPVSDLVFMPEDV